MNKDRGIIKWLPFESLTSSKRVVESILYEKGKVKKPILSLEQREEIEEKLLEAFYEQIKVTLKIYKNGYIKSITSTILAIDATYKKLPWKIRIKFYSHKLLPFIYNRLI